MHFGQILLLIWAAFLVVSFLRLEGFSLMFSQLWALVIGSFNNLNLGLAELNELSADAQMQVVFCPELGDQGKAPGIFFVGKVDSGVDPE